MYSHKVMSDPIAAVVIAGEHAELSQPLPATLPHPTAAPAYKGPKEPKTPYNFFCEARRPAIVEAYPEAKAPDISRMLGEEWQVVMPGDRAQYDMRASSDRARYLRECMAAGIEPNRCKRKQSGASVSVSGTLKATVVVGSLRPCPAMTALDIYNTAQEGRYVVGIEGAARFAALPEAEREGYEAAAIAEARRFVRETAVAEEAQRAAERAWEASAAVQLASGMAAAGMALSDMTATATAGMGASAAPQAVCTTDPACLVGAASAPGAVVDVEVEAGGDGDVPTVTASEVMQRAPYKKYKPKTRKPEGQEKLVLDAIERVRRAGTASEELIEGWSIKLVPLGDATGAGIKSELNVTAPDGTVMATVMDVKRKLGMVIKEASEARAESKALIASVVAAHAAREATPTMGETIGHVAELP